MIPLRDANPRKGIPWIVIVIIFANIYIYFQYFDLPERKLERFFLLVGLVPKNFSLFNLLSYQFLHGGLFHLISNMWALWIFGDNVEDRMGHLRFLIFYLLCGICAGLFHVFTLPNSGVPCVGASGAISGVLGAYTFLYPTARVLCTIPIIIYPYLIEIPAIIFGVFWFLTQLFNGLVVMASDEDVAGVAWWAHIGGFIVGILLLPFFVSSKKTSDTGDEENELME